MSAADEIRAAIEKLEAQRDAAVPGPWEFTEDTGGLYIGGPERQSSYGSGIWMVSDIAISFERNWDTEDAAAELIVTLHRTVDAQLAILREAYEMVSTPFAGMCLSDEAVYRELDLARAINGGAA